MYFHPYLGRVVDVGPPLQEGHGDVLVAVVGGDVERREAGLAGHVGVVIVLEQQRRRLGVVLLGGNVQRREADLASGVILKQHGDNLQHRNQWSEHHYIDIGNLQY